MIGGEVFLHLGDRQAAQPVVGAEFHHENLDVRLIERPVHALQAGGGRVARDARVDDLPVEARGVDLLLQQRRIGLGLGQPETRRQAVAEHDDFRACRRRRHGRGLGRGSDRRLRRVTAAAAGHE